MSNKPTPAHTPEHLNQYRIHPLADIIHLWGKEKAVNIPEGLAHSLAGRILKDWKFYHTVLETVDNLAALLEPHMGDARLGDERKARAALKLVKGE